MVIMWHHSKSEKPWWSCDIILIEHINIIAIIAEPKIDTIVAYSVDNQALYNIQAFIYHILRYSSHIIINMHLLI